MKLSNKEASTVLFLICAVVWAIYAGAGILNGKPNVVTILCAVLFFLAFLVSRKRNQTQKEPVAKVETERLILYSLTNEELEAFINTEEDLIMKQAYTEMLEGCRKTPEQRLWSTLWCMRLKENAKTIVGTFCFKGVSPDGMVEIGYGLLDGFCGKGYMTEAVRAISLWALAQNGITRVESETDADNAASQNVLERAGYQPTGTVGEEGPRYVFVPKETA